MHDAGKRIDAEALLSEARWASRLARRLVRDDAAAQDVVQSAFAAALESAPSAEGRLRPWLARVVRNFAAQTRRGEAHRADRERASARADRTPSAAETAERIESQRVLVEALAALEEPYRTTVTLRYLEGLSAAQIARRERIPAGTVRWRLKEGLDRLRARLDRKSGGTRGSWALALVPLVRRPPLVAAVAASGAALVEGVLVMNTGLKLGIAAALVVAASVGVWITAERPEPGLASVAVGEAPGAVLDAAPPTREVTSDLAVIGGTQARELVTAEAKATPAPPPVATTATLRARCVDRDGVALAGVRFEPNDLRKFLAVSASDGRIELTLEIRDATEAVPIVASHPGHAKRFERIVLDRGKTTELGDFVLEPGGAVAGVVVGPDGNPLPGAQIFVTKPELDDRLEALRRRGPCRDDYPKVPTGTTDASGAFLVDGVPARSVRVWAGAEGMLFAPTDPIDIAPGEMRSGLRIALEPLAPDDVIEGVVLDPDGAPVRYASVNGFWNGAFSSGVADSPVTGADGRFQIRVKEKVPHNLSAYDFKERWPPAELAGVRPGAKGVEVRFAPRGEFELAVRNRAGEPVKRFLTTVLASGDTHTLGGDDESDHEDGRVRLPIPTASFALEVYARGHAVGRVGPFEPGAVPASIECVLDALPGVRGRVVAAGKPVAGARVELHLIMPPGQRVVADGFPTCLDPNVYDAVRSDENGRFDLTVRNAGIFAITAEAEGLATTELSPVEIDPAIAVDGLEVAMTAGGSIEGRVLLPGGRDPAGTIVGASRGDGYPRTLRANADGSFRFDHLMPGRWNVTRAEGEVRFRNQTAMFSIADGTPAIPWNCTVAEGRTTRFDLDLRNEQACAVAATVAFHDRPAQGWTLSIETSGETETTGAGLDENGRARVETSRPGTYTLALRTADDGFDARFNRRTELARGEMPWNLDVAVGRLEGRVLAATNGNPFRLLYQARLQGGVTFEAWISPDAAGRFRLPFAPAGAGSILRMEDDAAGERRVASTRPVEVVAGETLSVDVD